MEDTAQRFKNLLEQTLIPDFCSKSARNMTPSGFRPPLIPLSEIDMIDFLRGWDEQLFRPTGNGLYQAPRSGASEQFFWSGRKANTPRTFTLWLEPIITLAAIARMHLDFGCPKELIESQSKPKWAFDVVGYESKSDQNPLIACEVKKSRKEIDVLINYMQLFGREPSLSSKLLKGYKKNALMKVNALRDRKLGIFWAAGPGRYEKVFSIQYSEQGVIELESVSTQVLNRGSTR